MKLSDHAHLRWRRLTTNIGYLRSKTPAGTARVLVNLADTLEAHQSTIRMWHTKRLVIIWDREK